jgi:hypothetical protein
MRAEDHIHILSRWPVLFTPRTPIFQQINTNIWLKRTLTVLTRFDLPSTCFDCLIARLSDCETVFIALSTEREQSHARSQGEARRSRPAGCLPGQLNSRSWIPRSTVSTKALESD